MRAILINIFGGITRGDEVARGSVEARARQSREVPMVVRIVGTNADRGGADPARAADHETADQPGRARPERAVAAAQGRTGMSILVDERHASLVQGITGREGGSTRPQMLEYGTKIVAGVTPGKGGRPVDGVPVFDTVAEAVARTRANASIIFVPAPFAPDAILEAADAGIPLVVCITEGIPTLDMVKVEPRRSRGARLIGPNCPGRSSPGQGKVGIMPGTSTARATSGWSRRSGTLTYEVGPGPDRRAGHRPVDLRRHRRRPDHRRPVHRRARMFKADPDTEAIVLIGEIGGDEEERGGINMRAGAEPVAAFIAGRTAPPGRRMGHAGAIISGGGGTAESGAPGAAGGRRLVADSPSQIPALLREAGYSLGIAARASLASSRPRPRGAPRARR